ncbi:hypothetical protein I316_03019 [Kwoniella heveanensis BCC8398]|uniref:Major facilitator superfamily (MFS) profile domain-containing protein n=1 Tax=Kwoniella heveanensis BCC8398 TaxID=1296120 RepID=A0A1B9GWQ7_9TREE|nr:hypothetical protein I316_03019 [Kwoniella heveanensis BCC8398]
MGTSALQWIFPVMIILGLPFSPESPWYLIRQSRIEASSAVLARLGAKNIEVEVKQLQETIALEDYYAISSSYMDCFRGTNRRRTAIALMVFVLQQIVGVIFVLGFSTYFFQLAGFDVARSFDLGVGVTGIGVVGNLAAMFGVNRFGRRSLFLWGMLGCTVVNLLLGISSFPFTAAARWVQASLTLVFALIYQGTIGPLGYVILSEVPAAKLWSKTVGLGIFLNSICGIIANIVIPYLVNPNEANLGGKVGFIFGGLGSGGCVWTRLYIPETKGKTVAELDQLFEAQVSSRVFDLTSVT